MTLSSTRFGRAAVLAAVAAMLVMAVGASAAIAELTKPYFKASETGTLEDHALTNQVFHLTKGGSNYVICEAEKSEGIVNALETKTQEVTVHYEKCIEHYVFFGEHTASVTVTPAHYKFHAEHTVDILEPIKIEGGPCTVTVSTQSALKTVNYKNNGKKLVVEAGVEGIHEESCLGNSTTGTYFGNVSETEPAKSEAELNKGVGTISYVE